MKFNVEIVIEADSEAQAEELLNKADWVNSYETIDEKIDEIPDNDDDDDDDE